MAEKQISDLPFATGITPDDEFYLRRVSDGADLRITRKESRSDLASNQGSSLVGDASGATVHDLLPIHLQFSTYADLRNFSYFGADIVQVTGNGIAGIFKADPSDTTTADNGGTVIVANDGIRWKRQYRGVASVLWFGAVGDGATDDLAAFNAAFAACDVVDAPATINGYALSATLVIPSGKSLVTIKAFGGGGTKTTFTALPGFATNTFVVQGGHPTGATFGIRVENLFIDCGHQVIGGFQSQSMQELSHVKQLAVFNFGYIGLSIEKSSVASPPDDVYENIWLSYSRAASTAATRCMIISSGGGTTITSVSCVNSRTNIPANPSAPDYLVEIHDSNDTIRHLHCEPTDNNKYSVYATSYANTQIQALYVKGDYGGVYLAAPVKGFTINNLSQLDRVNAHTIEDKITNTIIDSTHVALYSMVESGGMPTIQAVGYNNLINVDIGDADYVVTAKSPQYIQLYTPLTAQRNVTFDSTGVPVGFVRRITRMGHATGNYNLVIHAQLTINLTPGQWFDVMWDGAYWRPIGQGTAAY